MYILQKIWQMSLTEQTSEYNNYTFNIKQEIQIIVIQFGKK